MISMRKCRHCGRTFEAEVGIDNSIYCESCKDLVSFIEDTGADNEEQSLHPNEAVLSVTNAFLREEPSQALLETIQKNIKQKRVQDANIDSGRSFKNTRRAVPSKNNLDIPSGGPATVEIDDETLACLQQLELPI